MNAAGVYIAVFMVILFSGSVFCLLIYIRTRRIKKEAQLLEQQYHNYRQQYTLLERQIKVTRKFRHDLHNHLRLVRQLSADAEASDELQAYQNYLQEYQSQPETAGYCGQPVMDAIFSGKSEECRQEGIRIELHVSALATGKITDMDMALVLFNLFDNGIESCRKEIYPERRSFYMESITAAGYVVIKTVNTKINEHASTRRYNKNKLFHGLGLGIIEEIAEKYEGRVVCDEKAQQFETMVWLKYK